MKIAILSKMDAVIAALTRALDAHAVTVCQSRAALLEAVAEAEVLVPQNPGFAFHTIDAEVLDRGRQLRLIQQFGVSWDVTDEVEAAKRKIPVATIAGESAVSVAEHGFHLLMCVSKRANEQPSSIRQGKIGQYASIQLAGKTVCIVGLGKIGKVLARFARAFAMRVVAVKNRLDGTAEDYGVDVLLGAAALNQGLALADFTVLVLPLNTATFNLIGPEQFRIMKRGASLVNLSRGAHVDRDALVEALATGRLSSYAADAFWQEPADPNDPLFTHDRVIITPHVGGVTDAAIEGAALAVRDNIQRLQEGQPLLRVINMKVA